MLNKIFRIIIIYIKDFICLYFIYIFNILYYQVYYNYNYKSLRQFKKKESEEYYSYTFGTYTMDIIWNLNICRFIFIMFFYFYYILYVLKIIKFYHFRKFINFFSKIAKFLIFMLEFHYNLIMQIHLFKNEVHQNLLKNETYNKSFKKHFFLRNYSVYNTFFIFYVYYLSFLILFFGSILFNISLWIFTYYTRFINQIKTNKKYSIKYNIKLYKNKLLSKINNFFYMLLDKIFQNYNIRMTLNYYYNKNKRYLINLYNIVILKTKNYIDFIKEVYFKYFVNFIFFQILKNKGNLIIYYIFLFLKYLKSFFIWLWDSDIIYKILKKLERKKW